MCACCGWYQAIYGGTLFSPPQNDPQSVKVVGSYLSDVRFCPDIDLFDVFTLPFIKDTLADKVLAIAFELSKGNVRSSYMRIGVNSTKTIETVCKKDVCISAFQVGAVLVKFSSR